MLGRIMMTHKDDDALFKNPSNLRMNGKQTLILS